MLNIVNLNVQNTDTQIEILKNINLQINSGEIHYISGENGSGKSTLVSTIMGDPQFEVTKGKIILDNKEITQLSPTEKSLLGIFLASQHPVELPGVSMKQYLRLIYNIRQSKENQLPVFKFREVITRIAESIEYPKDLLDRNVNEGFSGGEKKKTEILQMLLLEPKIILLDEIDSGLDSKSRIAIFEVLKKYAENKPDACWIIVSHYNEIQEYLEPTNTHYLEKGSIR